MCYYFGGFRRVPGIENSNDQTARQPYKRPGGMREAINPPPPWCIHGAEACRMGSGCFQNLPKRFPPGSAHSGGPMSFKSFLICLLGVFIFRFFRFSRPPFLNSKADFGAVLSAILGRGIAFCVGGVHFFAIFWEAQNRFQNRPRGS